MEKEMCYNCSICGFGCNKDLNRHFSFQFCTGLDSNSGLINKLGQQKCNR